MKKQSQLFVTSLGKEYMVSLTKEVKETIAFGLVAARPKIFTAADLWNIQRQKKAKAQRRFL